MHGKIQEAGRAMGHFYDVTERDNNQKARQLAKKWVEWEGWHE